MVKIKKKPKVKKSEDRIEIDDQNDLNMIPKFQTKFDSIC